MNQVRNPLDCPQCRQTGQTFCTHSDLRPAAAPAKRDNPRSVTVLANPLDQEADSLSPDAMAVFVKLGMVGLMAAIGYLLLRPGKPYSEEGDGENEAEPEPETPFETWEPNN